MIPAPLNSNLIAILGIIQRDCKDFLTIKQVVLGLWLKGINIVKYRYYTIFIVLC